MVKVESNNLTRLLVVVFAVLIALPVSSNVLCLDADSGHVAVENHHSQTHEHTIEHSCNFTDGHQECSDFCLFTPGVSVRNIEICQQHWVNLVAVSTYTSKLLSFADSRARLRNGEISIRKINRSIRTIVLIV